MRVESGKTVMVHVEIYFKLALLAGGTSDLLGGPKAVFRGLSFIPKLHHSPFVPIKTFCSFRTNNASKTVIDLVESSEQN